MMGIVHLTRLFIVAALAIIVAYDVWAYFFGGGEATISTVLMGWSRSKYGPIIVFMAGALVYHLFVVE